MQVSFEYLAQHLPPRCRKFRELKLADSCTVEIAETTDAPVAIRHQGHLADKTVELRFHAGRLWEKSDEALADVIRTLAPRCYFAAEAVRRDVAMTDPAIGRVQEGAARREAIAAIEHSAANLLLIDGVLHTYAEEPYWTISHGISWCSISLSTADPEEVREWPSHYMYRADQLAEARRCAEAENEKDYQVEGSCEVLIPAALRLDPYGAARNRKIAKAVEKIRDLEDHVGFDPGKTIPAELGKAIGSAVSDLAEKAGWTAHERMAFAQAIIAKIEH